MGESQPPQPTLAALRASGAWRRDPARFLALEALARRLPAQPPRVQRILEEKLQRELVAYAAGEPPPRPPAARKADAPASPLAQLNAAIRAMRPATDAAEELASVRRFRRAWDRGRALEQVERAVARGPAQAGPLNSHMLVLQSLDLMRSLSPDYLRHFVLLVESLQWLEQAGEAAREPAKAGKAAKPARRKSAK